MLYGLGFVRGIHGFLSLSNPHSVRNIIVAGVAFSTVVVALFFLLPRFGIPAEVTVRLLGVPVEISLLTLILCIIFWVQGDHYIRTHEVGLSHYHYTFASSIVMVIVVLSIAIHELSHGLVALAFGNPIDHAGFSWWGAFVAPANGLATMSPLGQILVALAGPFANLVIAGVAALFVFHHHENLLENSVQFVAVANIQLGRFNMIPLFVFDGGKAVDGILRLVIADPNIRVFVGGLIFYFTISLYRKYRKSHKPLEDRLAEM